MVIYSDPVYFNTILPMMFICDVPSMCRVELPTDPKNGIGVTYLTCNGVNDKTFCYQIKIMSLGRPKTDERLYNTPTMKVYIDGYCYNVYFTNVICKDDPNINTGNTINGGGSQSGSDDSYKNGSEENWEWMQDYIKKWPNN